jgi:hypothetical protein
MSSERSIGLGTVPIEVKSGLGQDHASRFQKQFVDMGRDELELLWRRTQQPETKALSGMEKDDDRRRRMIHGLDRYAVIESNEGYSLVITDPYIWFQVVSPHKETRNYLRDFQRALIRGRWIKERGRPISDFGIYRSSDLTLEYEVKDSEEKDILAGRLFPAGYNILEVVIHGDRDKTKEQKENPWYILRSGMRARDIRGDPRILSDLRQLEKYFPMQVELGCGPSIESGIPPLHYFHTLYYVSEPIKGTFIFGPDKDKFLKDIVTNPTDFYRRSAALYSAALVAEPTPFYRLLQELHSEKVIVGDIITNNFDGLCSLMNLKERYIRRFDEPQLFPEIDFHPEARSLLVVGAHADRRKVEKSARDKGLQVIYVDPEGYKDGNGRFVSYPLESPQDADILIRMTARHFTDLWKSTFG